MSQVLTGLEDVQMFSPLAWEGSMVQTCSGADVQTSNCACPILLSSILTLHSPVSLPGDIKQLATSSTPTCSGLFIFWGVWVWQGGPGRRHQMWKERFLSRGGRFPFSRHIHLRGEWG